LRIIFQKSEQQQPEYRYTLPNGVLTNEQREFYEKNGFIVIRNLVSPETLEKYRSISEKYSFLNSFCYLLENVFKMFVRVKLKDLG
jgi:hypothetical protein